MNFMLLHSKMLSSTQLSTYIKKLFSQAKSFDKILNFKTGYEIGYQIDQKHNTRRKIKKDAKEEELIIDLELTVKEEFKNNPER